MRRSQVRLASLVFLITVAFGGIQGISAQQPKSQEVSEVDGEPVLLKHLPDYANARSRAVLVTDKAGLAAAAGSPAVLNVVDFPIGTEAAVALYPAGRLMIVEYSNPQASIEVDDRVQQFIANNPQPGFVYRRIGNYNAFVFEPSDADEANGILDQIKYEKTVQWLGEDPYLVQKLERYMITQSRDIAISTVLVIVGGLGTAVVAGIIAGFIFFRVRDQRRASRVAFSDAGGLTRLNLDGLSEEIKAG